MTNKAIPAFKALILAAGGGTRMKSKLPKVMHPLAAKPLISHVLDCAATLSPKQSILVLAPHMDGVKEHVNARNQNIVFATQEEAKGTGNAVASALEYFKDDDGIILILYGDTPLIRTQTLETLLARHHEKNATISLLGMQPKPPTGYGRLVMDASGHVQRIVECKDANEAEKNIDWVWAGVIAFDAKFLSSQLPKLQPSAVTGEYYLTSLIEDAHNQQKRTIMVPVEVEEAMGINKRVQLAQAEAALQNRLRTQAMEKGVTMTDPSSVYLCEDTKFGQDIVIQPNVVFGPNVEVENDVTIKAFSHIEGARICKGATVGPYARLRPGTVVDEKAHVGNFVELKNTHLGKGAKANHLSYVGDTTVGENANIGAGTITCNYDGINKYKTEIEAGAFIGSNSALVAPVKIGNGALIGAGSVITQDVPADDLALARAPQSNLTGRAKTLREEKLAQKNK